MDAADFWKIFASTFGVVFLAELGDKTQLATLLLASNNAGARWAVFLGSAGALTLAAAIGVLLGAWISYHVPAAVLKMVAGLGFVVMGFFILSTALPN